jgi:hypothetical protein
MYSLLMIPLHRWILKAEADQHSAPDSARIQARLLGILPARSIIGGFQCAAEEFASKRESVDYASEQ